MYLVTKKTISERKTTLPIEIRYVLFSFQKFKRQVALIKDEESFFRNAFYIIRVYYTYTYACSPLAPPPLAPIHHINIDYARTPGLSGP